MKKINSKKIELKKIKITKLSSLQTKQIKGGETAECTGVGSRLFLC
ncbi:hypothetical protein [Aquimarina aggregata]|nr:hypothetical protein [Aquimarina aggregata]